MSANGNSRSSGINVIRLFARVSGVLIGGFFLFIFIWETLQSLHPGNILHVNPMDAALLILLVLYGVGMFVALKWERKGLLLSLGALGVFHLLSGLRTFLAHGLRATFTVYEGVLSPIFWVFWFPVILYLVCLIAEARKPGKA